MRFYVHFGGLRSHALKLHNNQNVKLKNRLQIIVQVNILFKYQYSESIFLILGRQEYGLLRIQYFRYIYIYKISIQDSNTLTF